MTFTTTTGYVVARAMGRTMAQFPTLAEAQAFAQAQDFDTEITAFICEELA